METNIGGADNEAMASADVFFSDVSTNSRMARYYNSTGMTMHSYSQSTGNVIVKFTPVDIVVIVAVIR